MTTHCAVACPVVTEAVKAATPEAKLAMALAAIESEKISLRAAAERFGVPVMTLQRKAPGVPDGTPGDEEQKPEGRKGKDGKTYKPPAAPAEIAKAWEMKDSGMSTPAIAKDLGRGEQTIRNWLSKDRPQEPAVDLADAPASAPDPEPPPLILEPPSVAQKPKRPQVPDNLKQAHQREQKWIRERWQPIAEHLRAAHDLIRAEKERLCKEYAGAHGSLIMQRRWQQMAEIWAESGLLNQFAEITGEPEAVTLESVLSELERSSRMANSWISCVAVYTGCKPDPTRYQPTSSQE